MNIKFEDILFRSTPLELKRADTDLGLIAGHAAVFGNVDSFNEVIVRGAFAKTLAKHQADGRMPVLLWSHDPSEPVGKILSLREDAIGLFVEASLNRKTSAGKDAYEALLHDDVSGMSIGFRIGKEGRMSNGDGTYSLTEIDLVEISIVSLPANPLARIHGVKMIDNVAMLERGLKGEIPLALSNAAAKKVAKAGYEALTAQKFNFEWLASRLDKTTALIKKGK